MKLNWIIGVLCAAVLTVPVFAQVGVYIGVAPPPLRYERRGPMPGVGYAWVDGYWAPHGHSYSWVGGRWDHAPYEGAQWNHPHYDHYKQGWQLHEGHWDHENHDGDHHDR
jgi:WXXGXW repeat (2 copies)